MCREANARKKKLLTKKNGALDRGLPMTSKETKIVEEAARERENNKGIGG